MVSSLLLGRHTMSLSQMTFFKGFLVLGWDISLLRFKNDGIMELAELLITKIIKYTEQY